MEMNRSIGVLSEWNHTGLVVMREHHGMVSVLGLDWKATPHVVTVTVKPAIYSVLPFPTRFRFQRESQSLVAFVVDCRTSRSARLITRQNKASGGQNRDRGVSRRHCHGRCTVNGEEECVSGVVMFYPVQETQIAKL
jgi:hypothetical protein